MASAPIRRPSRPVLVMATTALLAAPAGPLRAQAEAGADDARRADSTFIAETEQRAGRAKVQHAEPLYIDLIRDLGARRGEAEWNVGFGLTDKQVKDEIELLVEYEWAVRDRVGLEVEVPVTLFSAAPGTRDVPPDRVESLKLAAQWTYLVLPRMQASFALGYIHQFELHDPNALSLRHPVRANLFNPFTVSAKRWGQNWHTLLYAGAQWRRVAGAATPPATVEAHPSVHYLIPGTRNFVGVESNAYWAAGRSEVTFRPQMRLGIRENLLLGIAVAVPGRRDTDRLGTFVRAIWEPKPH